jgi:hypothetical protein
MFAIVHIIHHKFMKWYECQQLKVAFGDVWLLSCMYQPVQPKSLSWWGKVGNSLILQPPPPPSRVGSPRPHTWILEWAVIILINAPARIRTRDLWLWYHIELHSPTSSTQKLKLIGKVGNSLILQQWLSFFYFVQAKHIMENQLN